MFESVAVATGVPYGRFSYSEVLGPPLFGLAPPTVLLAWTPLILGALALTRRAWQRSPCWSSSTWCWTRPR